MPNRSKVQMARNRRFAAALDERPASPNQENDETTVLGLGGPEENGAPRRESRPRCEWATTSRLPGAVMDLGIWEGRGAWGLESEVSCTRRVKMVSMDCMSE